MEAGNCAWRDVVELLGAKDRSPTLQGRQPPKNSPPEPTPDLTAEVRDSGYPGAAQGMRVRPSGSYLRARRSGVRACGGHGAAWVAPARPARAEPEPEAG